MKIRTDEILAVLTELRAPRDRPAGVFTTREGADALGVSQRTFLEYLHQIAALGRLEIVAIQVPRLDGRGMRVSAYRIRSASKLKRA